ncbi:predicted protein [Lichtheimia corymbifera JMRC:FSU:9682]|uniref:Uncharacterized protein n=1 Tax=Lichtheimia corymbifera JMRC:FSU:9682 TaxID=1263082 RepID=A0A068SCN0_9FUNG|nr:predicted protein [Lichtheimia corymbifera JMRC:FSU:9682]
MLTMSWMEKEAYKENGMALQSTYGYGYGGWMDAIKCRDEKGFLNVVLVTCRVVSMNDGSCRLGMAEHNIVSKME